MNEQQDKLMRLIQAWLDDPSNITFRAWLRVFLEIEAERK